MRRSMGDRRLRPRFDIVGDLAGTFDAAVVMTLRDVGRGGAQVESHINLPAARASANVVLTALVQSGLMTEGQVLSARMRPADIVDRGNRKSPDYFLDWAFEEAKRIAEKSGVHSMVARTTLDMNLQRAAEESL